ncbi:hypothetical protein AWJ20_2912 [Sugiyamaella lignohabitans]|uniref:Mediator of RNA polymerase II transcription subunit 1 n=1 Tax=Sugiyamaella lignohabitans TaxID=796027 RepID=A0A167FGY8_9ASCO|nr:uncharacterized protein AWJ20_2912 [Sugiyamaella lignohabitans]ANB15286.1 hypothetical protein AWJ20_2912 [Sugiyamaella lignohabitans]
MTGNSSEEIILKSLREPRLDKFAKILAFLSRLDKLSGKQADCFRVVDEISNALHVIYESQKVHKIQNPDRLLDYGVPVINPDGFLGLGIQYWSFNNDETIDILGGKSSKWLAFFDVKDKSEVQNNETNGSNTFPLLYTQDWVSIDGDRVKWADPEPLKDTNGRLVLRLDPPVIVSEAMAIQLGAELNDNSENSSTGNIRHSAILNNMNRRVGSTSRVINNSDNSTTQIDISYANLLPYSLIQLAEIPVNHPRDIQSILSHLRSFLILRKVWTSLDDKMSFNMVTKNGIKAAKSESSQHHYSNNLNTHQDGEQLSFADAIMEYEGIEKNATSSAGNMSSFVGAAGTISAIVNLTTEKISSTETNTSLDRNIGNISSAPIITLSLSLIPGVSFKISTAGTQNSTHALKLELENLSEEPIAETITANLEKLSQVLNISEDLGIFLSVLKSIE